MTLLHLGNSDYLCGECGKVYDRPDVECCLTSDSGPYKRFKPRIISKWLDPNTGHTVVREDIGFGQIETDVESEIVKVNEDLVESIKAGKLKHVLGMRIRLRDLSEAVPGKYRFLTDGRAVSSDSEEELEEALRGVGPGSPDAPPTSPAVSPLGVAGVGRAEGGPAGSPGVSEQVHQGGSEGPGKGSTTTTNRGGAMGEQTQPRATKSRKTVRECLCGCGRDTRSNFAPGHDSKVKVMCSLVDEGKMKEQDLPPKIQEYYTARQSDPALKLSEWFGKR